MTWALIMVEITLTAKAISISFNVLDLMRNLRNMRAPRPAAW
jgi:hypothetical protein